MRAALLLLPLALSAACLRNPEFHCSMDGQCTPGGVCQTAVGYCSFPDSACSSGQRYADSAGQYANACVGEQTGSDGGMDGPRPDTPPSACPAMYMQMTGGTPGHLYARAPTNQNWVNQDNYCKSTGPAYIAVPDDANELTNLRALAGATFWVGIHDRIVEGRYDSLAGGQAVFKPFDAGAGEPDDPGNGQDCVAATATNITTEDCTGNGTDRPAVCECVPP